MMVLHTPRYRVPVTVDTEEPIEVGVVVSAEERLQLVAGDYDLFQVIVDRFTAELMEVVSEQGIREIEEGRQ